MVKRSAGILIHRRGEAGVTEVLLVHPGGPFWAHKDIGSWSIPKGGVEDDEEDLSAARREVQEEIGALLEGPFEWLGEFRQPGGKIVVAWTTEAEIDACAIVSNDFEMQWPPKSGLMQSFPEVDRAAWYELTEAENKILKGQRPILSALKALLSAQRL